MANVPTPTLGGASFVQLVTALNMGLLGIRQLRYWLDWTWRRLEGYIAALTAGIDDQLRQKQGQGHDGDHAAEVLRLKNFLIDVVKRYSAKAQHLIWLGCALLAGVAFLAGLACLYFDRYCPSDAWLLLPWPLYWLLSLLAYACLRFWAWWRAKSHAEILGHVTRNLAKLVAEAERQADRNE